MNNEDKTLSFIGLAARSRNMITGEELTVKGIQRGQIFFVIITEDASENTKKKVTDKCKFYNIPFVTKFNRYDLGHAVGKEARVVVGITDEGFSKKLEKLLE